MMIIDDKLMMGLFLKLCIFLTITSIVLTEGGIKEPIYAANVTQFRAEVDKNKISQNETVTFKVIVEGDMRQVPNPTLPSLDHFTAYSSGRSQSFSIGGPGGLRSSITFNYVLQPQKTGKFTIGPVTLTVDGKKYQTQPIDIEVTKGQATPKPSPQQSQTTTKKPTSDYFVELTVDNENPYVNEMVVMTFQFYRSRNVMGGLNYTKPKTDGFWTQDLPPQRDYRRKIDNKVYLIAELKTALFPTAAGQYQIGPAELEIMGTFFQAGRTLRTSTVNINVQPLPKANQPADFKGDVGNYSLSTSVDRYKTDLSTPLTLVVTVEGKGNIDMLSEPVFPELHDFKFYDSNSSTDIRTNNYVVSGSKTYEKVLIPKRTGSFTIDPIIFSYFDPRQDRYRTLKTKPISILVEGSPIDGMEIGREDVRLLSQDIRHIKPLPETLNNQGRGYLDRPMIFWTAVILPLFGLMGVIGLRSHQRRLETNAGYARFVKAAKSAQKQLLTAKTYLSENDKTNFYAIIDQVIIQYLSDKLNMTPGSISRDKIQEISQLTTENQQRIIALMDQCDFARFSSAEMENQSMADILRETKQLINDLEKTLEFNEG